jgi:hypothetical protein
MPIDTPALDRNWTGLFGNRRQAIAYNTTNRAAATGDGTAYTVQLDATYSDPNTRWASNTYTAQEDGVFLVTLCFRLSSVGAGHTTGVLDIVTTARSYRFAFNPASTRDAGNLASVELTTLVPMSKDNTLTFSLTVSGSTKTVQLDGAAAAGPAVSYASIIRVA